MLAKYQVRALPDEWKKVNLGCNQQTLGNGWINVDIEAFEGVDVTCDLEQSWPWEDDSVDYIRAFDIVEHLHDSIHTMNEAWRVLRHGGVFEMMVPSTDGRGAFQDPTHVSFWNQNSFMYYSRAKLGAMYPSTIQCDYEIRQTDTPPNNMNIIWCWALCRAIKAPGVPNAVPDLWYNALSNQNPELRAVAGFKGNTLGTLPLPQNP